MRARRRARGARAWGAAGADGGRAEYFLTCQIYVDTVNLTCHTYVTGSDQASAARISDMAQTLTPTVSAGIADLKAAMDVAWVASQAATARFNEACKPYGWSVQEAIMTFGKGPKELVALYQINESMAGAWYDAQSAYEDAVYEATQPVLRPYY